VIPVLTARRPGRDEGPRRRGRKLSLLALEQGRREKSTVN